MRSGSRGLLNRIDADVTAVALHLHHRAPSRAGNHEIGAEVPDSADMLHSVPVNPQNLGDEVLESGAVHVVGVAHLRVAKSQSLSDPTRANRRHKTDHEEGETEGVEASVYRS